MEKTASKHAKKIKAWWVPVITVLIGAAVVACEAVSICFFDNVRPSITIEAGERVPSASEFLKHPAVPVEVLGSTEGIGSSDLGRYSLEYKWLCFSRTAELVIQDTVPPKGEVRSIVDLAGRERDPMEFMASLEDATKVQLQFKNTPDFNAEGLQDIIIIAEDEGGNRSEFATTMTLYDDTEAPVISGVHNHTLYVGETISYRSGVSVKDNVDPNPTLEIDNTQVDLDKPGTYPVTYTARDFFGNTSSITVSVTVEAIPTGYENIEKLYELADSRLAQLITPKMTEIEKAYAIFHWIRTKVPWQGGRVEHNYVGQAIRGLSGYAGDCYTCTVTCKVLLERAGFEVKFMERTGVPSQHYWVMIKVGGDWYHMDPSPIYIHQFICFLGTDDQLKAFNQRRANYYNHDWDKFPATPTTSPAEVVLKNGQYTLVIK